LIPKQERFVKEYLIDLNATQAATRAGYSAKTADRQGYRLLRNAEIDAAVTEGRMKLAAKLEVTVERIVAELAKIGLWEHGRLHPDPGRR
jgi:phage terminase small subunit